MNRALRSRFLRKSGDYSISNYEHNSILQQQMIYSIKAREQIPPHTGNSLIP